MPHTVYSIHQGGSSQKTDKEGGLSKKGALGQFADLRGACSEREGGVFEGEVDTVVVIMFEF